MRKFLLVLIIVSFSASAQHGGWTKKSGEGYYKLSEWWQVADEHFVKGSETDPNATRGTFITSLYAERGITDKLTGIIYLPLFVRTYQNTQVNILGQPIPGQEGSFNNGIGDMNLSLKYGLGARDAKFVKSLIFTLGIPSGEKSGGSDGSFQTGDGEFNQMLEFDVSRSFQVGKANSFFTLYSGFNNRTGGFSDEVRFGGEIGFSTANYKSWLFLKLDAVESLKNGTENAFAGATIFANNTEFMSYTIEVAKYLSDKLGASFSYSNAFTGEIIFADPAYSIGLFLEVK